MKNITMSQLEELGFKVVKSYTHDEYVTQRRNKGCITIETTWELTQGGKFVSQDATIETEYFEHFSLNDLKLLDAILNKEIIS